MRLTSRLNPASGISDFWHEFRKPTPFKWPILGCSALLTFGLLYQFLHESWLVPPAPPKVTYIQSFAADRSETEIIASNIENQKNQEAVAILMEQNEERKRDLYRTLGRVSGMDTDAIEQKAAEERAAAEAAEKVQREELLRKAGANAKTQAGLAEMEAALAKSGK